MDPVTYLRQFRVGEYAVFDFTLAFGALLLASPLLTRAFRHLRLEIPRASWLYFTLPISILIHVVVGNITPMTRDFFDPTGHVILKCLVLLLTLLGMRRIRMIPRVNAAHKKTSG